MSDDEKPTGAVAWSLNALHDGFVPPRPAHHLSTPAAAARAALRDFAAANPVQLVDGKTKRVPLVREELDIVAPLPPWQWAEPEILTGAPLSFARAIQAAGWSPHVLIAGEAVEVRLVAPTTPLIRAWWKAGRTTGVVMGGRKVTLTEAKAAL